MISKDDGVRRFRFKDMGKIHLKETERPSPAFLGPTRNRNKAKFYIDESDSTSMFTPNDSVLVNTAKHRRENALKNTPKKGAQRLPKLNKFSIYKTHDSLQSKL